MYRERPCEMEIPRGDWLLDVYGKNKYFIKNEVRSRGIKFLEIPYCLRSSLQLGLDKGSDTLSGSSESRCEEHDTSVRVEAAPHSHRTWAVWGLLGDFLALKEQGHHTCGSTVTPSTRKTAPRSERPSSSYRRAGNNITMWSWKMLYQQPGWHVFQMDIFIVWLQMLYLLNKSLLPRKYQPMNKVEPNKTQTTYY